MVTVSMMSRFDCYSKTKHLIIKDGFHWISSDVTKINLYMLKHNGRLRVIRCMDTIQYDKYVQTDYFNQTWAGS